MGDHGNDALNYFFRKNDLTLRVRHDKVRHKVMKCPTCGKGPLRFLEANTDEWYLGEFDDENHLVRHVCKMKDRFKRVV